MLKEIEAKLEELEAEARYVPEPIKEMLRLIGAAHDKANEPKPIEPPPVAPPVPPVAP